MALLMETPPDGVAAAAGQLSDLYSDLIAPAPAYNFALLNLHGQHGGNVLTTTLPGVGGTSPWLNSIDADGVWRADSHTTVTAAFRISTQNDTESLATWQ